MSDVFDATVCKLGEGPLWHPERHTLFWFDILGKTLHWKSESENGSHTFQEFVSAAGWVDRDTLMIASASGLWRYDIPSQERSLLVSLEADNSLTRSNDGRADAFGGFWIGTMGINAEPNMGAIYRYYRGELRKLYGDITISNAICFSPDGLTAYFTDTHEGRIMRQALSPKDGWPVGEPSVFLDFSQEDFGPDGAVIDTMGNMWNAQWGASRVACYSPAGDLLETITLPASQISCPAFGGHDLKTLFATSATIGLSQMAQVTEPLAGQTFAVSTGSEGQREHQVLL